MGLLGNEFCRPAVNFRRRPQMGTKSHPLRSAAACTGEWCRSLESRPAVIDTAHLSDNNPLVMSGVIVERVAGVCRCVATHCCLNNCDERLPLLQ